MGEESGIRPPVSGSRLPPPRRRTTAGLAAAAVIGLAFSGQAATGVEPPALLNYQGVLRDPNNVPLDGSYIMYFRFYDAPAGGNQILRDLHRSPAPEVVVTGGLFNVQLGSGIVVDGGSGLPNGPYTSLAQVFRDFSTVYMEVEISGETLSPRIRIVSSAYALNADHLDGKDASEYLDVSATSQSKAGGLAVGGSVSVTGGLQIQAGSPDAGKVLTATDTVGNAEWQLPPPGPQGPPGPEGPQGVPGPPGVTGRPVHSLTIVDSAGDVGLNPSVTIGVDGLPIISYYDATLGDLKVAHCLDVGCTISEVYAPLGMPQDEGQHSSITIGADGLPIISFVAGGSVRFAQCSNRSCSSATNSLAASSGGPFTSTSISLGVDGLPIIAHVGPSDLWVTHCEDAQCVVRMNTLLDTPGGAFASHVIDTIDPNIPAISASASAIISYEEATDGRLRLALCRDVSCSVADLHDPAPLVLAGRGRNSSIAIGLDGVPVFSTGFDNLYFVRCANTRCSDVDVALALDLPEVMSTSITIGVDGMPIIGYHQNPDPGSSPPLLKVAHCEAPDCASYQTFVLDTSLDTVLVGDYLQLSMTIGTDGFPLIAYTWPDATGRDLKVAHCSNWSCIPWYRKR